MGVRRIRIAPLEDLHLQFGRQDAHHGRFSNARSSHQNQEFFVSLFLLQPRGDFADLFGGQAQFLATGGGVLIHPHETLTRRAVVVTNGAILVGAVRGCTGSIQRRQ